MTLRSTPLLLALLAAPAAAQNYRLFTHEEGAVGSFGHAVAVGIDCEPDGFADVVVGSPFDAVGAPEVGRVSVFASYDGLVEYVTEGQSEGDWFGYSVAVGADWNSDGIDDLIVGAPQGGTTGGGPCSGRGYVRIVSGSDGVDLLQLAGPQSCSGFGTAVALVGDVNGDGFAEIAVGAPDYQIGGAVYVVDLLTPTSPLVSIDSPSPNSRFGESLASFRDVDGDGVRDLLAGAPLTSPNGPQSGSAYLLSSARGTPLHEWRGQAPREFFGSSVADVGDVDGDGVADVAIGGPQGNGAVSNGPGLVRFFSGGHGHTLLTTLNGSSTGDLFGVSVAPVGDPSGDGRSEVAVGAPGKGLNGAAEVWTLLPDAPWSEVTGESPGDEFGSAVAAGGFDVNLDGSAADYLVGAPAAGRTQSFSTQPLSLQTDVHEISLAAGGMMTANLDAGDQWAGYAYYVLGSATGTVPGTLLINMLVPLNWGPYFCETIVYPNIGPLGSNLGSLDPEGKGTMTFTLGAGALGAPYVGLHLDHLMIVFDPSAIEMVKFVGELAPLTLVE